MSNFIPHFIMGAIISPCWDLSQTMSVIGVFQLNPHMLVKQFVMFCLMYEDWHGTCITDYLPTFSSLNFTLVIARETHTGSVSVALCAKWKSASSQLRCVHTAKYKKSGIQLQITLCRLDHKYLQFPPTHKLSPLVRHLFHTEFLFTIKTPRHTRRCPRFSRVLKFVGSGL